MGAAKTEVGRAGVTRAADVLVVGVLGRASVVTLAFTLLAVRPAQAQPAEAEAAKPDAVAPVAAPASTAVPAEAAAPAEATAPAAAVPPAEAGAEATPVALDGGSYQVRLRDLERQVGDLKEQVFRSKSRLALLAESVLQGVVAGSQARIVHEDRMSATYRLVRVVYALDGAPVLDRADEQGLLGGRSEFQVFNGSIAPGEHVLTVNLEYSGQGFGMFNYMKGYRFTVRSSYSFTAPAARVIELRVVGHEKGGPVVPVEQRPALRFAQRITNPKAVAQRADTTSSKAPTSGSLEPKGSTGAPGAAK